MLGNWSQSVDCELRAIRAQAERDQKQLTSEESRNHEQEAVFVVLGSILAHKSDVRKAKLLTQVQQPPCSAFPPIISCYTCGYVVGDVVLEREEVGPDGPGRILYSELGSLCSLLPSLLSPSLSAL